MCIRDRDIGVLYGNLVDNAVEACSKVPEEQRFVKIENKYQSGSVSFFKFICKVTHFSYTFALCKSIFMN